MYNDTGSDGSDTVVSVSAQQVSAPKKSQINIQNRQLRKREVYLTEYRNYVAETM